MPCLCPCDGTWLNDAGATGTDQAWAKSCASSQAMLVRNMLEPYHCCLPKAYLSSLDAMHHTLAEASVCLGKSQTILAVVQRLPFVADSRLHHVRCMFGLQEVRGWQILFLSVIDSLLGGLLTLVPDLWGILHSCLNLWR